MTGQIKHETGFGNGSVSPWAQVHEGKLWPLEHKLQFRGWRRRWNQFPVEQIRWGVGFQATEIGWWSQKLWGVEIRGHIHESPTWGDWVVRYRIATAKYEAFSFSFEKELCWVGFQVFESGFARRNDFESQYPWEAVCISARVLFHTSRVSANAIC
jgi:hypothetical protein